MKNLFITLLAITTATCAFAQIKGSSIYIGGVMPYDGHTFGAVIGYKYQIDLPVPGLGVILGADLTLDGTSKDVKDLNQEAYDRITSEFNFDTDDSEVSIHYPLYFNIPIKAGLNYSYQIKQIRLWVEAAAGMNMAFRSNTNYSACRWYDNEISGQTGERHYYAITKYKPGFAFAWNTGIGIMFKDAYSIGINIQGLGKYKVKSVFNEDFKRYYNSSKGSYTKETELGPTNNNSAALVQIRFGFHF